MLQMCGMLGEDDARNGFLLGACQAFEAILPLVNVSLFLSIAFNFIYLFTDPPWLKSLGDLVNAVIGFVVLVWMWNVFPFTFPDDSAWMLVARCLLAVTIAATAISSVVLLVMTARAPFASRATASYREHPQGHH